MNLKIKQQPDGTWLIQGDKSCDWCRPPEWPMDPKIVVGYCGCMASKAFKRALKDTAILCKQGPPKCPPNTEHKGPDHPKKYQCMIDANRRANERLYFGRKKDE